MDGWQVSSVKVFCVGCRRMTNWICGGVCNERLFSVCFIWTCKLLCLVLCKLSLRTSENRVAIALQAYASGIHKPGQNYCVCGHGTAMQLILTL